MSTAGSRHPNDQALRSYGLGKLDDATAESVSKHLESCSECQSRVAAMSSDSFLDLIRDAQEHAARTAMGWADRAASHPERGPAPDGSPPPVTTMPPGLADHPDYEVIKELGRGGMGVVYLAHNRLMGRNEVLKVMSQHIMERPGVLARFMAEIRAVARLQHPNIVTAYSAFRLGESIAFAMEYVDGLDLSRLVKAKGPVPVLNACYFVNQAAQGMQHAHEQGMVHRDIKPGNLMLSHKGQRAVIKVLDFGLAKVTREAPVDGGLTNPGQALGTPDYMAPEQIRDAQKADIRADIYSLGCTLYYLLSGGPPFRANNLWDLYQAHHSMDAMLLNFARPEVPTELAALVARMMAKEPERRFQTPADVACALTPFFKKGNATNRLAGAAVSHIGQPAGQARQVEMNLISTQPATGFGLAASPLDKRPTPRHPSAPARESLIEFQKTEPVDETAPRVVSKPPAKRPVRLWPTALAGVLLVGALVLWAAMSGRTVATPDGSLVIERVPESAVVEVDGTRLDVKAAGGGPFGIQLKPGPHGVTVKRNDTVFVAESVTILSGKETRLTVRREPVVASHPGPRAPGVMIPDPADRAPARNGEIRKTEVAHLSPPSRADSSKPGPTSLPPERRRPSVDVTTSDQGQGRFAPLFNGKDIAGWTAWGMQGRLSRAETAISWRVRDGILHGVGGMTHLFSPRGDYKNFRIDAEVKINDRGNSGIFFRVASGLAHPSGYEAQINSTHSDPNKTGSLYRRPQAPFRVSPSPVPPDTWFRLGLEVVGSHIRIWVNDRLYVDWIDSQNTFTQGHIAIQTHHPGSHVQIRKLEVLDLDQAGRPISLEAGKIDRAKSRETSASAGSNESKRVVQRAGAGHHADRGPTPADPLEHPVAGRDGFVRLFNGKDLTGWKCDRGDPNVWSVDHDGNLVADGSGGARNETFLLSERSFSDCLFRFEFKLPKNSDSGVAVRAINGGEHVAINLRNIDDPPGVHSQTGALRWSTSGGSRDYSGPDRLAELRQTEFWNEMLIELRGERLRVLVNGREVRNTDLRKFAAKTDALPGLTRPSGRIGFQSHTGTVRFREIEIKELGPSSPSGSLAPSDKSEQKTAEKTFNKQTGAHRPDTQPPAEAKAFRG
jgi:hypothetical protein